MKKLNLLKTMLLLCALIVGSVNSVWAGTITFSELNLENGVQYSDPFDGEDFTVTFGGGGNDGKYYTTGTGIRVYGGGTMTIAAKSGEITNIKITYDSSYKPSSNDVVNTGIYNNSTGTWTGSAASVVFTRPSGSGHWRVQKIEVTVADSDDRTDVNMTSFTATKTTLLVGEETETTVINDQADWTAAYTYESSDEAVATVSAEGVITAEAKGTAKITATLNVDAGDANYKAGSWKSKSIDITVTNPFHNVTFYRNGVVYETTSVEEGEDVTFPDDPSALGGKSFVGWVTAAIDGTTSDEPEFVTSATMGTADLKYYAVYANATGGGVKEVKLENSTIESNQSGKGSYSNDYNVEGWTGRYLLAKVSSNYFLQLGYNTSSSRSAYNSHLTTPLCESNITSITIETGNNTKSSCTFYLTSANNLGTASDENATYGSGSISEDNGSVTINVVGDTKQLHIYPSETSYLVSISLKYGSVSYSDYCTTVKETATVGDAGYATYVTKSDVEFAANDAYAVTIVDGKAVLNAVTKVPAGTAVLLKGSGEKAASVLNETPDDVTNDLMASHGTVAGDDATIYVLANINNKVGFYLLDSSVTIPAGKAYLQTANGDARQFIGLDDESTGISATLVSGEKANNDVYDLSGRKIVNGKLQRGLYIVNGKKVVVR